MAKSLIKSTRLELRPYRFPDIQNVFGLFSDAETMRFLERPFTLRDSEDWIIKNVQRYMQQDFGRRAVYLQDEQTYIGDAGFHPVLLADKWEQDLGIVLKPEFQRNGFGLELGQCLIEEARNMSLKRLCCHMLTANLPGQALAEALCFERELVFNNPKYKDSETCIYALELGERDKKKQIVDP